MSTHDAVEQLMRSERGEQALRGLRTYLELHGFSLDACNQRAILTIVRAWFSQPHETRDAIDDIDGKGGAA